MGIKYNGTDITAVKYNGTTIDTFKYNGTVVFQRVTSKTYRYKATAIRCGTSSLGTGNTAGVFRVDNQAGMWCFNAATTDITGYGVTLQNCLSKNITSMKFMAYRANTNAAASAGTSGSAWSYGVKISDGGISTIWNVSATNRILRQLPTPSAVGVLDQGLTTNELKTIFGSGFLYSTSASGSGIYAIPTGNYWAFGCKAQYSSGQIQFRCDNVNNNDAYIEIVTQE